MIAPLPYCTQNISLLVAMGALWPLRQLRARVATASSGTRG